MTATPCALKSGLGELCSYLETPYSLRKEDSRGQHGDVQRMFLAAVARNLAESSLRRWLSLLSDDAFMLSFGSYGLGVCQTTYDCLNHSTMRLRIRPKARLDVCIRL